MYVRLLYISKSVAIFISTRSALHTAEEKNLHTHTHIYLGWFSHQMSVVIPPFLVCVSFVGKPATHIHMCILYYQISIFFLLLLACFIIPICTYVRTHMYTFKYSNKVVPTTAAGREFSARIICTGLKIEFGNPREQGWSTKKPKKSVHRLISVRILVAIYFQQLISAKRFGWATTSSFTFSLDPRFTLNLLLR
jgi:hypothetical protein